MALLFSLRPQTINAPLRDMDRTSEHPFPATVWLLSEAIKRLRARAAQLDESRGMATAGVVMYRGMRNMELPESFVTQGGTEHAPMSTTTQLSVAVRYALSRRSLLFRVTAPSFMQAGADLSFVSAFSAEQEMLYPPGTYLRPTGQDQIVDLNVGEPGASVVRVIDVEPLVP